MSPATQVDRCEARRRKELSEGSRVIVSYSRGGWIAQAKCARAARTFSAESPEDALRAALAWIDAGMPSAASLPSGGAR